MQQFILQSERRIPTKLIEWAENHKRWNSAHSYCEAYSGTNRTFVTLYGDQNCFDNNVVFYDSPSGGNSTNLFGNYAVAQGCASVPIGAVLDYDGRVQGFYSISANC